MIRETAYILAAEGDKVTLETQIKSSCGACVQAKNCGTSTIAKAFADKKNIVTLDYPSTGLEPGQQVTLGIAESAVVNASALIYLMPVLVFLAAAVFGQIVLVDQLELNELANVLFSFSAAALSYLVLKNHINKPENLQKYHPSIIAIEPISTSQQIPVKQM